MRNMKKANDTDLFFLKLLANIDRFYEYCIKNYASLKQFE